jgi:hypothetical protein
MRKPISVIALLFAVPSMISAQTPFATRNVGHGAKPGAAGIAANNPWLGAQVSYRFGESDAFADNLLVSGRLLYDILPGDTTRFHLPVMGNVGPLIQVATDPESDEKAVRDQADQLLLGAQGVTVGLYPYIEIRKSDRFLLTFHSVVAWRLNALHELGSPSTSDPELVYLLQGRFATGVELVIGSRADGRRSFTLSVTPTLAVFGKDAYRRAFGEEKWRLPSLEATAILPLGAGVGVLFEGIDGEGSSNAFRMGLLVAAQSQ